MKPFDAQLDRPTKMPVRIFQEKCGVRWNFYIPDRLYPLKAHASQFFDPVSKLSQREDFMVKLESDDENVAFRRLYLCDAVIDSQIYLEVVRGGCSASVEHIFEESSIYDALVGMLCHGVN